MCYLIVTMICNNVGDCAANIATNKAKRYISLMLPVRVPVTSDVHSPSNTTAPVKPKRGRPKNSKNKPKPQSKASSATAPTSSPIILTDSDANVYTHDGDGKAEWDRSSEPSIAPTIFGIPLLLSNASSISFHSLGVLGR
jgi:hypothetical protein